MLKRDGVVCVSLSRVYRVAMNHTVLLANFALIQVKEVTGWKSRYGSTTAY